VYEKKNGNAERALGNCLDAVNALEKFGEY